MEGRKRFWFADHGYLGKCG